MSIPDSQRIFLDNNSTTQPLNEVVELVAEQYRTHYANPGSAHAEGRQARRVLEDAREQMASLLGSKPQEVIFTSGGTEAINLAIQGFLTGIPGEIALTDGEHPATVNTIRRLSSQGMKKRLLKIGTDGRIDQSQLPRLDWERIQLVTIILAHNETGVIQEIAPIADICEEKGVPLHLDCVQAIGKIPFNFQESGATAISLGAHKFHGPRGIGAIVVKEGARLLPQLVGGHQERGRRAGTEPVALAAGMAHALKCMLHDRESQSQKIAALRDRLQQALSEKCAPVVVNGSQQHRLANTLNISFPGLDGEALLISLDLAGISCSLGSACASGSRDPAPVMLAMNCEESVYRSAVRLSLSILNTSEEIEEAIRRISRVVNQLRS
ncbi:MAG: cysteine desulfurase [Planctomycetes bacterium]|nr:cysteine desulfurase [Planctomycetota bacterium]MCH9723690.1 cysteine desulfurase [Planctomycetota bacterium]MCH9776002.1 cysteine desulfurase [Planctomycetota bacterium]MCH9791802.1 cysteine desulfurase [Planctomycetota bacterium]MDF1745892.1 cysteine desulfurase family protein [Gimesia sp.]